jgi:hypothetical protein
MKNIENKIQQGGLSENKQNYNIYKIMRRDYKDLKIIANKY